jgi:hypothetical protein
MEPGLQTQRSEDNPEGSGTKGSGFGNKSKKSKLSEKQKAAIWQEYYLKTQLDRLEIFHLEELLVLKGVKVRRINPKSIDRKELVGEIIPKQGTWIEGLLTQALREFNED